MGRARSELASISLFPFLSILVCLMGILAFIMVAIVLISTANPEISIRLQGQKAKTPAFVECHGGHMILHPNRTRVPLDRAFEAGSPFIGLLDEVAAKASTSYVIVFVYPEGIGCFREARALIEERALDIGYEPVLKGWRLRLESRGSP